VLEELVLSDIPPSGPMFCYRDVQAGSQLRIFWNKGICGMIEMHAINFLPIPGTSDRPNLVVEML
jgi:hypothetical protein